MSDWVYGEGGALSFTIELRDPGDEVRLGHDDAMLWLLVG